MNYEEAKGAIESSIRQGISAEDADWKLAPIVLSFTETQIQWVAAWLAGDGFGKR